MMDFQLKAFRLRFTRALTLFSRLASEGEDFLAEVLPFFCSQVDVAGQQSAGLQVAAGGVKESKPEHRPAN